jgi:hypothetical protein
MLPELSMTSTTSKGSLLGSVGAACEAGKQPNTRNASKTRVIQRKCLLNFVILIHRSLILPTVARITLIKGATNFPNNFWHYRQQCAKI